METQIDLDLNYNNTKSEILSKDNPRYNDIYQQAVTHAKKYGLGSDVVDEVMSNATGNVEQEASDACEAVYESQGSEAFNKCRRDYIAKAQRGNVLNNVLAGISAIGDAFNNKGDTLSQPPSNVQQRPNEAPYYPPAPKEEVKILGMKPLVFALVSVATVTVGAIVITKLVKK